ncbi:hypothetical protein [Tangfeifania diversioriginum]|uniref:hypothetical protein n=1 Tax=Tangfeifania diversioriginum TaxID=1168035 RepID=UPI0015879EED|nr:hypothetical protein [Tangfeifania diversioriginum]
MKNIRPTRCTFTEKPGIILLMSALWCHGKWNIAKEKKWNQNSSLLFLRVVS